MMILNRKCTHTAVAFHNGADALHANAVFRFMRYRDAVFKWNMIPTGVFYLPKVRSTVSADSIDRR